MPDNLQVDSGPSLSSLVGGIINDAQQLIRQEVTLARREIQDELTKAKSAAVSFGTGVALAVVGVLLLGHMLVYLLHWLATRQYPDGTVMVEYLPLWGCYAIVGGLSVAVAGGLLYAAKSQAKKIDLVPRQTVETMKENVQWIKNQT
jgi:hypothetical protein